MQEEHGYKPEVFSNVHWELGYMQEVMSKEITVCNYYIVRQSIARYEGMLKADSGGYHPLIERDWQERERREQ